MWFARCPGPVLRPQQPVRAPDVAQVARVEQELERAWPRPSSPSAETSPCSPRAQISWRVVLVPRTTSHSLLYTRSLGRSLRKERGVGLRQHDGGRLRASSKPPASGEAVTLPGLVHEAARLSSPPPRGCRAAALLSTTSTSSTCPVSKKPSMNAADRVPFRVCHEDDRDRVAVPHARSPPPADRHQVQRALESGRAQLEVIDCDPRCVGIRVPSRAGQHPVVEDLAQPPWEQPPHPQGVLRQPRSEAPALARDEAPVRRRSEDPVDLDRCRRRPRTARPAGQRRTRRSGRGR